MAYRHGANALKICELAQQHPELRAELCPCEQTCYAEAVYCIQEENVAHLTDLRRRCRLGMGPCQGTQCAGPAAALFARQRGLSAAEAHRELLRFLDSRFQVKRPVLDGDELAQEELNRATYLTSGNLDGNGIDG
jgi:glycerol-3-phosphate dehydrogenase